ncbi:RSC complex subunit (Sth1) [Penicillium atrosanguineum]|uniref:RSC complex subunit (Sth1) n=1 Tax=Penicillium atrosanguineum TaxID=1132637 RepID=A0A9W9U8F6_9EURO|nr:RSC complex subunit (Sth1) [Penicillium atrosanguineum]
MTSLQPTPNMARPNQVPMNMSKVKEKLQRYQQLKAANVAHDDPEFVDLQNFVRKFQEFQEFSKNKAAMSQQQMNGAGPNGVPNGAHGRTASNSSAAGLSQRAPTAPGQPQTPGAGAKGPTVGSGRFTQEQVSIFRDQVTAFRTLARNQPLPAELIEKLFADKKAKALTPAQNISTAEKVIDNANKKAAGQAVDITEGVISGKEWYDVAKLPDVLHKHITYGTQPYRISKRFPAFAPAIGIDMQQIRADGERILYNRITSRINELEQLSANVGAWDTSKSDVPSGDDSTKLSILLELRKLRLWQKQQRLRQQLRNEELTYSDLQARPNHAHHRRMKRPSLREARITEKLEKQQRDARETREKKKQWDQLQAIINHGAELANATIQSRTRSQKLGRMMLQHHQHMEREEQRRVERTAKQRLQALKANDEETYMKLLGQAKDSRISHLLKQTDKFLKELAASVKRQQRNQAERYGDDEDLEDDDEEIADSEEDEEEQQQSSGKKKVDYYAVAHRVKEEVTEQPSILVGGSLKEYQLKGLQWMISLYNNNLNGILADEMGLGKTIQTISLIAHIIEKKRNNGPFLVIVPLSTLTNWNIEFDKWAPSVSKVVYKGPPNARKQQQQQIRWGNFQVLLTTYEYIIKDRPILSKVKWTHMIIDEGHRMKNSNSKLSSTLSQYYVSRYRLILTGTPLQNNLPELWALLNFVLPNIFKSVKSFDEWFNTPFANTGGQDRMDLSEEEQLLVIRRLHKVLRPFLLRRLKKDVEKDLPDKQERVIKCRFSALQTKLYKQLVTHNKMAVSDGKGGKTGMRGLSNMLMQLRKLCNHPFVFEPVEDQMNPTRMSNDLLWRTAGKFELLDRILPKFRVTGHRVLMFFQMTQIMNIMEDFLRLRGLKYLRLDGSTKSDDRSDLLKLFNEPGSEYFCFLLSTRAGGLGLNLQTADTVIIYDSDWNPHQDLQAQDRAHRIGQKNEVRILRLISSNSVEEKILERAQFKLDMDGKVIQAGKFDNKSTNEERDALLRTLLDTAEAAEQIGDQDEMDDDDLNEIMARSEDEIGIFQEIDKQRQLTSEYGPGKRFPRLMCEEELPDIYMQEDNPVTEEVEAEVMGRGARERKVARYDDGLSERQFLEALDDSDDDAPTLDEVIERNARRATDKVNRKEARKRNPQRKKRRRVPVPPPKRKAEEIAEETPQPKRKRGRQPKIPDTLSSADRATLNRIVTSVVQSLKEMEQEIQGESSDSEEGPLVRAIIDPFMKPPPRAHYPDYYMIIKNPIAIDTIEKKIKRDDYQSLKEFRDDIHLLCQNARTYNEDGSLLYQDANDIEAKCVSELKRLTEDHPEFANFDDPGSVMGDGQSTGADTPMTAGTPGQPKLKLKFNNNFDSASLNGTDFGDEE